MIKKTTTLKELLNLKGGMEILAKYNLPCLSCPMAAYEIAELKIGEVAEMYGLDSEKIIKDFNSLPKKVGK